MAAIIGGSGARQSRIKMVNRGPASQIACLSAAAAIFEAHGEHASARGRNYHMATPRANSLGKKRLGKIS